MIKRIIPFALLGMAIFGFQSCKNNDFKKTKDGLEYKIVKDEKGEQRPAVGDIVKMHIYIHVGDSALFNSRKLNNNEPIEFPVMPAEFKGDWTDGLTLLSPGDSAVFRIPADSVAKRGQIPAWMKKTDKIIYEVVMVSVKSQAQARQEMEQQMSGQKDMDDRMLQEYFSKNGLAPQKTASGLYYIIEKQGSGATPTQGQIVTVNYTGKTLDGKTFDSNVDPQFQHVQPFEFAAGAGQVIRGWDEGIMLLNKGSKAKFFIPSTLAYGPQSPGPGIDANAILMFDVEVTNIK
ncbi:MAG: peptidylprolyl isomerase [Sphingobacteriales bacterium]|nr:MAG: peptidylprolyl isomerase [Sphingobacteriales bacterium]